MRKLLTVGLAGIMAFSLVACNTGKKDDVKKEETKKETVENVEIPTPFDTVKTIEEAIKIAGYDIKVPNLPGLEIKYINVFKDNKMIEIAYGLNGREDASVTIRKAAGSGDISGDFNEYSKTEQVDVDGVNVTIKSEDKIHLATWENDGYTYSINAFDGLEMNQDEAKISFKRH